MAEWIIILGCPESGLCNMGWVVDESCNFLVHIAGMWQYTLMGQSTAVILPTSSLGDVLV